MKLGSNPIGVMLQGFGCGYGGTSLLIFVWSAVFKHPDYSLLHMAAVGAIFVLIGTAIRLYYD